MKRRSSFLWVFFALFATFAGCGPSGQSTQTPSSALVKIDCFNASVQPILLLLRSGRGKDISVKADGPNTEITVAFSPEFTSTEKLLQLLQQLNDLSGVMHVEVVENPRPILQNF